MRSHKVIEYQDDELKPGNKVLETGATRETGLEREEEWREARRLLVRQRVESCEEKAEEWR